MGWLQRKRKLCLTPLVLVILCMMGIFHLLSSFSTLVYVGYRNFINDEDLFEGCSSIISSQLKSVYAHTGWNELRGANCEDREEYFIIKDVFKTTKMRKIKDTNDVVTVITQTTPNHVAALEILTQRWNGPISVAIFLCLRDIQTVLNYLHIYRDVMVSFHFVAINWKKNDSSVCEMMMTSKTGFINPREKRVPFPFNVLRNVALSAVRNGYVFMTDIDMVPAANLHDDFIGYIESIKGESESNLTASFYVSTKAYMSKFRTAYVIPSFEAMNSSYLATNKRELLIYAKHGFMRQYAVKSCNFCQKNTNYKKWLSNPDYGAYHIARKTNFYEPFYILHRSSYPRFDERFKDRGFNRISQVCEVYMSGVNFMVLNSGFLMHRGYRPRRKNEYETNNYLIFKNLKDTLKVKYDTDRKCS